MGVANSAFRRSSSSSRSRLSMYTLGARGKGMCMKLCFVLGVCEVLHTHFHGFAFPTWLIGLVAADIAVLAQLSAFRAVAGGALPALRNFLNDFTPSLSTTYLSIRLSVVVTQACVVVVAVPWHVAHLHCCSDSRYFL